MMGKKQCTALLPTPAPNTVALEIDVGWRNGHLRVAGTSNRRLRMYTLVAIVDPGPSAWIRCECKT